MERSKKKTPTEKRASLEACPKELCVCCLFPSGALSLPCPATPRQATHTHTHTHTPWPPHAAVPRHGESVSVGQARRAAALNSVSPRHDQPSLHHTNPNTQALTLTAACAPAAAAVALPALTATRPSDAPTPAPGFRKGAARVAVHEQRRKPQ